MKSIKKSNPVNNEIQTIHNLIIVDESGSMSMIEREALAGINETIDTCAQMQKLHPELQQLITLVTFDSSHFKTHFKCAPVDDTRKLTERDYQPGGATPLYDAIGKSVSMEDAYVKPGEKVLVTLITDGYENCSREFNLGMITNLIEKRKSQGWTFTFIGTDNLDVESMSSQMGIDHCMAFSEDAEGTMEMFRKERVARSRFNACLANNSISEADSYFRDDD